jgi:hypothetical protein
MPARLIVFALFVGIVVSNYESAASAGQTQGTIDGWQQYGDGSFSFVLAGNPTLCSNGNISNQRGAVVAGVHDVTPDGVKTFLQRDCERLRSWKVRHCLH